LGYGGECVDWVFVVDLCVEGTGWVGKEGHCCLGGGLVRCNLTFWDTSHFILTSLELSRASIDRVRKRNAEECL